MLKNKTKILRNSPAHFRINSNQNPKFNNLFFHKFLFTMSNPESVPLQVTYKAKKEDLISLVSKCQQRNFSDEVDYLEELGGTIHFLKKGYILFP